MLCTWHQASNVLTVSSLPFLLCRTSVLTLRPLLLDQLEILSRGCHTLVQYSQLSVLSSPSSPTLERSEYQVCLNVYKYIAGDSKLHIWTMYSTTFTRPRNAMARSLLLEWSPYWSHQHIHILDLSLPKRSENRWFSVRKRVVYVHAHFVCIQDRHVLESIRLPFIAQTSNRYVIIWHVIHPRFTLPLPFVAHICTCRPLSRRFKLPSTIFAQF